MKEYFQKYLQLRKHNTQVAIKKAKQRKMCYLFLAPYAIIFTAFVILPVITSIYYSFTYYNILEPARFIRLQNYISLILEDDVFLTGVKNNLGKLRDAYDEIVTADESAPVMSHTQSVVAGLTYGRNSLNENLTDAGSDRGFRV